MSLFGPFGYYQYRSDTNVFYRVRLRAVNASLGGFSTAAPTLARQPIGLKLRYVIGVSTAGNKREVHCATTSVGLWTGSVTSFSVDGETFKVVERKGERRRRV